MLGPIDSTMEDRAPAGRPNSCLRRHSCDRKKHEDGNEAAAQKSAKQGISGTVLSPGGVCQLYNGAYRLRLAIAGEHKSFCKPVVTVPVADAVAASSFLLPLLMNHGNGFLLRRSSSLA